jgi:archaellum component FlaF (FlaF/FlaG flagellin family)
VNKEGSPTGTVFADIVKDDGSGKPSEAADDVVVSGRPHNIEDISTGNQLLEDEINAVLQKNVKYHIVWRTDAAYKASFVTSTTYIGVREDQDAGSEARQFDGSVWGPARTDTTSSFKIEGQPIDLRVKITSSTSNVSIKGLGIYYGDAISASTTTSNLEYFTVDSSANTTTLTVSKFVPDRELIEVHVPHLGQVFKPSNSTYRVSGMNLIFNDKFFYWLPAESFTVVVDQNRGAIIDTNAENRALLSANHLTDPSGTLGNPQPGEGIFLKRPDGTIREIAIDDDDNIVIYSV